MTNGSVWMLVLGMTTAVSGVIYLRQFRQVGTYAYALGPDEDATMAARIRRTVYEQMRAAFMMMMMVGAIGMVTAVIGVWGLLKGKSGLGLTALRLGLVIGQTLLFRGFLLTWKGCQEWLSRGREERT